jgi:hypothetical protein
MKESRSIGPGSSVNPPELQTSEFFYQYFPNIICHLHIDYIDLTVIVPPRCSCYDLLVQQMGELRNSE